MPCADRTARGDSILWLHPGRLPPGSSALPAAVAAFEELQQDLQEVMRLRLRSAEYQVCGGPAGAVWLGPHCLVVLVSQNPCQRIWQAVRCFAWSC